MAAHIKPFPAETPPFYPDNEPRAVFVDTNLRTHIAVSITPYSAVLQLQQLIALEHFNCFPKYGRILIKNLKVKVNSLYYHLPETMLLKSAFLGVENAWSPWIVTAEVWTPGGTLEVQRHNEAKHLHSSYIKPSTHHDHNHELQHIQPSTQHDHNHEPQHDHNHKPQQIQPSTQHDHNHKPQQIQPSTQHDHNHKPQQIQPSTQHDYNHKPQQIQPSTQHDGHSKPSSEPQEIPDTSSKKKKKRKKKKDKSVDEVDTDLQPTAKPKENTENKNYVLKTGSQDMNTVQQKDYPVSDVKEQLNTGNKPPVRPCVVHNLPAVVQGTSTNLAVNLNKENATLDFASSPGSKAKKSRKKKNIRNVAITDNGYAFPEKGDAPSDNGNTIIRSEQKAIAAPAEVSRSQLNNVQEPMPQQVTSNLEKNTEEDFPLTKPDNDSKKRKASESKQESQSAAQKVLLSHLNNNPELLAEGQSLNLVEKVKEIEEAVAPSELENTGKKRKTKKAKSSSTTQDLSSGMPNDSEKTDGTRNIHGELSRDIGRSDKNVETASVKLKIHVGSSEKQQLDEEIKEMASSIQSDKLNKRCQKKQPVSAEKLSSVLGNQDSNETMMKMNASKNVDDNDRECKKTADVASLSLLNDISKGMLSQVEPSKLIEKEKETKDDVALFKSEKMTENWRTVKAKSSVMENQLSSSRRDDQDGTDGTKDTLVEVSALDHLERPEGSVETMNGKSKRSRNQQAVPGKGLCGSTVQKQLDEEANDKSKKRTRKKQPALEIDFSSLPVDQQLDDNSKKMDSLKKVDLADDLLTNCDIDGLKNQKKVLKGEGHRGGTSEIPSPEDPIGLADLKNADKPRASKQKPKKLDQLTSVDTSSNGLNLVESKNTGSAKTSELQKSISKQKDLTGVSHASVKDASMVSGTNFTMEMNAPKKIDDSLMESTSSDDVPNQNAVEQGKDHDESSAALGLEDSAVLDDVRQNEKGQASKQKVKKVDQSSSIDTSSNEHNLLGSKNNRGIAKTEFQKSITDQKYNNNTPPLSARQSTVSKKVKDTLVPPVDLINTSGKTGVSSASSEDSSMSGGSTVQKIFKENKAKGPSNKLVEDGPGLKRSSRLISKEKKGGLASSRAIFDDENSSSSDEEDTDGSNSSTTLPPDDDSENESKGVVDSKYDSPKHNGSSKVNSSAFKLESILRSSSRYKKAKLTASQSQDLDEPPEFVPDSLADM